MRLRLKPRGGARARLRERHAPKSLGLLTSPASAALSLADVHPAALPGCLLALRRGVLAVLLGGRHAHRARVERLDGARFGHLFGRAGLLVRRVNAPSPRRAP